MTSIALLSGGSVATWRVRGTRMNVQSRFSLLILLLLAAVAAGAETRPRAREIGLSPGILAPGPLNAITDVAGVRVGHATIVRGEAVRTGVTAVIPHGGNLFREKV